MNPDGFTILDNGSLLQSGSWSSGISISQSLNGFTIGVHNLTILLWDLASYWVNDTVFVTVEQSGYIAHSAIQINSDSQFISIATSESWAGNGTFDDPYIIQWYELPYISITDVTLYFEIQNCYIHPSSGRGNQGISFRNVDNATVENCVISTMWVGVWFENCFGGTLYNLTVSDCNLYAVELWSSTFITVSECDFLGTGVFIDGYSVDEWNHNMDWASHHNTVNGKRLGYFFGYSDTVIQGADWGQIILANCYRVQIVDVEISSVSVGIKVGLSDECEITSSIVSDCEYG